jgi:Domain of unknown function (DUF3817)
MSGALTRFRVMAYVVGVFLLILVGVAMPLKYFADRPALVGIVGPIHGFLYMVYLAGTIPVMSFVAERKAVAWVRGSDRDRTPTPAAT